MTDDLGTSALRFEREGSIAWCTIDRPAARNALTPAMYFGIKRAVRSVNRDPDLAAMIITGTGDVFAPGGDLAGRAQPGDEVVPADYQTMFWALDHSDEPREGMLAFMEKRPPRWIPEDLR